MSPVGRVRLLTLMFLIQESETLLGFSNLTSNDPYPPYSAQYPYIFLSDWPRDYYRGLDDDYHREFFVFSITPFRQTADSGKNIDKINVALGDLKGRWNMLGLFYSANPNLKLTDGDPANLLPILQLQKGGTEACPYVTPLCQPPFPISPATTVTCPIVIDPKFADLKPYPFITTTTVTTSTTTSLIPTTTITEPGPQIGRFAVPIDYRKYGVRFSFDFRIWCDIGLKVETGVADITQIAVFNDLTPYSVGIPISGDCAADMSCVDDASANCKLLITDYIMDQLHLIAKQLGLSTKNFHTTGIEDTRVALYWQRIFPVNEKCDGWPLFLCIPFLAFEAIAPTAKEICPTELFAVPLGNNGHTGFGFGAGIDFDFVDSISFGFQASMIPIPSVGYIPLQGKLHPPPRNKLDVQYDYFFSLFHRSLVSIW